MKKLFAKPVTKVEAPKLVPASAHRPLLHCR